ncbi:hypothetical protein [Marinifilum caeruleilacunae]|uniref:Uncharacterized protein n=1 Tax=Marinifilum caeruleilacunae TaxID=2499076 RepID=A0ABX1WSU9_9BACT|nr:hypothetical protein [Marinifilum caeruleilacunae]NOU59091.1 hypothetical protein [Marinifilum caeruleilacunae]
MTTPEIKGFFSKEHTVLVFLICICFAGLIQNYRTQQRLLLELADIKADIKIITYRLNYGKIPKEKLASFNLYRCEGTPQLQKTNSILACRFRYHERIAKGKHRIY